MTTTTTAPELRITDERRGVHALLSERALQLGDKPFIACGTERRTYAEMADIAERGARGLMALGIAPGDRVATIVPNRIEMLELLFACARLGAILVPINTFLKGEFLRHQLDDCGAVALVVDEPGLDAATPVLGELPALERVTVLDDVPAEATSRLHGVDVSTYAELMSARTAELPPGPGADDILTIVYTSGTTGRSKGCIITNGYYGHVGRVWGRAWDLQPEDVLYTAFPLFHLSGQALAAMTVLTVGMSVVFEPVFSASEFFPHAAGAGATIVMGVGAMAMAILATPPSEADRAHRVRFGTFQPLPEAKQLEFEERFGVAVSAEGYGQTEVAPATYSPITGERRRSTVGRAAPWLEVCIHDDEDNEVSRGEVGEIVVRPREPDSLFAGYWGQPEVTVDTFRNLWHHTGDLGRMDEEGFITFVDRKKDALRRRGENVSSLEVEMALMRHEKVAEVAVHAVPAASEDDIKVCLVLTPGAEVSPEEIFDYCKANLPYFAMPRYVDVLPELPKNAIGRVLKHQLRDAGVTPGTWDLEEKGLVVAATERR